MTGTAVKSTTSLITRQHPLTAGNTRQDLRFESAFVDYDRGGLTPDCLGHIVETKRHLAQAISRQPMALRLHTERILLHAKSADPAILGALCDLFLVLGNRGVQLRRRMLALARPLLSTRDHQRLQQHIREGYDEHALTSDLCPGSVLAQGITGTTTLIVKESPQAVHTTDPLLEARSQLETGQTELALETLEQALLTDTQRLELHQALLEIHHHLRDRSRLEGFLQRLGTPHNPAEGEWKRLLKQLEAEATDP